MAEETSTTTAPSGTSSTPSTETSATTSTASTTTTQATTSLYEGKPAATETATTTADPSKGSETATTQADPKSQTEQPLFVLPEDFKPREAALTKFTELVTKGTVDGKLTLSPQQVADAYVEMARDANSFYEAEIARINTENEAACKAGFTAEELTAAETAVGWVTSRFDKTFRDDYAKRQLNDPRFTRLMVLLHDAYLTEDTFEPAGRPGNAGPDKRPLMERAQEKLYGGKSN